MTVIPWIDWSIEAYWMGRPWEVLWGINECTVQFYPLWYVITVSLASNRWLIASSQQSVTILWAMDGWMQKHRSNSDICESIGAIHQVRCFYYLCYTLMETLMYVNTSFCRRSALRIRAQRAICLSDWVPWESYYAWVVSNVGVNSLKNVKW